MNQAHQVGTVVTVTADVFWNGQNHQGRTGPVVEAFPFEGGVGYLVRTIEGRAPLPVWSGEVAPATSESGS